MDVAVASLLLVVLAPVLGVIVIAIKVTSKGSALYVHERVGRDARRFRCYKFRTMVVGAADIRETLRQFDIAGGPAFKMRRDPRVTPVGRWLRRWSLDEVPQLINVVRGDMSLVGPRPLAVEDFAGCDDRLSAATRLHLERRLEVAPGLTGLWQVSGRSELSFDRWMELDAEYVDRRSILFDCWLIVRTVPAVLSARGAY